MTARPRDALLLAAWQMRGWAHGATRGPWKGRAVALTCLGAGVPLFGLLVALMAAQAAAARPVSNRPELAALVKPDLEYALTVAIDQAREKRRKLENPER